MRIPWIGQCSTSEIMAWRDHLYQNLDTDSESIEQQAEFLLCQDVCQPESRSGRKVGRLGLWLALQKGAETKLRGAGKHGKGEEFEEDDELGSGEDELEVKEEWLSDLQRARQAIFEEELRQDRLEEWEVLGNGFIDSEPVLA